MPKFDSKAENKSYTLQPAGDYRLRVMEFEIGISRGKQTSGSESYDVKIGIENDKGEVIGMCHENLIDHPSCDWKISLFLKCMGVKIADGAFEFNEIKAKATGVPWVNPLGLRGWGSVKVEEYEKCIDPTCTPKKFETRRSNKVAVFIVNKEKLPRVEVSAPEPPPAVATNEDGDPAWE